MKIHFISDTHGWHRQLKIDETVDVIVHSGDCTNYREDYKNQQEFDDFIDWYSGVNVKHKLLCGGNHDVGLTKNYNKDKCKDLGIIYLEHEYTQIDDKLFFGSPYTPTFGNWFFMIERDKIYRYWEYLEEDIDVLFTHGMPYGILDLTEDREGDLKSVGDKALLKRIRKVNPKFYSGGHIHSCGDILNYGTRTIGDCSTVFMNNSLVEDGRMNKGLIFNGQIITI